MRLHISPDESVPVYIQIVTQIGYLVASGRLKPGNELPSIRVLAKQLLINPNTVVRAYRELETAGLVTKRHGVGTYVSDKGSPLARRERARILRGRVDALLVDAQQLDFDVDKIIGLVRERHRQLRP